MKSKTLITLILVVGVSFNALTQEQLINRPVKNFEKLWEDFNNHYAFFELKDIDWEEMYLKYRPVVNDSTTNDSLFIICCKMINELNDRHVSLTDKMNKNKCHSGKPSKLLKEFPTNSSLQSLVDVIDSTLARNQFKDLKRVEMNIPYLYGNVIEYTENGKYGYLRINLMFGLSKKRWNQVLNDVIESFRNVQGIIIDVRFNSGGYDNYSYQVAGRFVNKEQIGHFKSTKKKKGFTKLEKRVLKPIGDNQLIKPIVLLTSGQSMSATDVLVLIMKNLPYVNIIGDNTKGIFSDIKELKLPNGWIYTLSTQKYLSADMKNYEGVGISPDIKILNTKADIDNDFDPLLQEAIKFLNQKMINK